MDHVVSLLTRRHVYNIGKLPEAYDKKAIPFLKSSI